MSWSQEKRNRFPSGRDVVQTFDNKAVSWAGCFPVVAGVPGGDRINAFKKSGQAGTIQAVELVQTPFFDPDNPGRFQQSKMFGDGRDVETDEVTQIAHTHLSPGQSIHHLNPGGVGKAFDDLGTEFGFGERKLPTGHVLIFYQITNKLKKKEAPR